jgi:hypothetical protein
MDDSQTLISSIGQVIGLLTLAIVALTNLLRVAKLEGRANDSDVRETAATTHTASIDARLRADRRRKSAPPARSRRAAS